MKILGDKVRYYRKIKGLSQSELADGICTQATISLIEKKNKVPSMNILMKLCNRLDIRIDDVIVESEDKLHKSLKEVDDAIKKGNFSEAKEIVEAIKLKSLKENDDLKRYYYYEGMIQLFANEDPDEAIFYFGRTLNQFVSSQHDIYGILATLGTGLSYANKRSLDRAKIYVDQALLMLKEIPLVSENFLEVELNIYWNIAKVYYELNEFTIAIRNTKVGVSEAVKEGSLYLIDELYAIQGKAYMANGENAEAEKAYIIAYSLADVRGHDYVQTRIKEEIAPLNSKFDFFADVISEEQQ